MKLFTIFGNPVEHSISPKMHNLALRGLNLDGCYIRTKLEDGEKIISKFNSMRLDGANVTVPHKEYAYKLCDELDSFANKIGAVNTLVKRGNKVYGYNTDAPGFFKSIEEFGKISYALILGAGGTAKAIATILKENGIKTTILNRSQNRLDYFIKNGFDAQSHCNFKPKKYDLVINTTSAGLSNNELPLQSLKLSELFKDAKFAYDVIYNKETPFLSLAKKQNLICKDGADMLLYQGVLAFNLFFNNKLNEQEITKHMKKAFKL